MEATDPLEPPPVATAPDGETEGEDEPVLSPTTESPSVPDVTIAPSEPTTSDPSSAGGSTSTPCTEPSCSGGTTSGGDEGECGAGPCPRPPGAACAAAQDCESRVCTAGVCQLSSCSDAVQNADEADTDCGGAACVPCPCTYGTPEVLGDPNFAGNLLFSPSLSADGLTLFFGLYVQGAPTETIAVSTRPSRAQPFGFGNTLPAAINASVEGTPRLAPDGLTLYFYSERVGGLGGRDIYRAERATPGAVFDVVTNLTEINSGSMDHLPWVSADEREIVFASYRLGGSDFFRAIRAPGEASFRAPELLASISSDADDTDPALTPDGSELYFTSTREGTDSRIWRVARSCP